MKRVLLYIGITLAAIGCAQENTMDSIPSGDEITFSAGVTTRVSSSDDCQWADDDLIGVYTFTPVDDQLEVENKNLLFTISDAESGKIASTTALYPLLSGQRTFYAYHPYSSANKNVTQISIDCTSDQSKPLLWATATSNDTSVELQFSHKFAKVIFNLTAGGVDATLLADMSAWLMGAYATGTFDITSGEFTFTSDDIAKIALSIEDDQIIAYIPPASNVKLWIVADNNTFLKSFTDDWVSGSSYEYVVTVGEEPDATNE